MGVKRVIACCDIVKVQSIIYKSSHSLKEISPHFMHSPTAATRPLLIERALKTVTILVVYHLQYSNNPQMPTGGRHQHMILTTVKFHN